MNGAPGGSRQSQKAPPEGGTTRQSAAIRPPTQQQLTVSVADVSQTIEAGPSCQPSTSSQVYPSVVQQSAAVRESFPMLHSPAVQHPLNCPPQFEMQLLQSASSQVAAGLRYSQPSTSQQPLSRTNITLGASPLSSLPSPFISSASLFTGIGLSGSSGPTSTPGSGSGPDIGSPGQSPLLVGMNPALLAQYQVILAAAAQQHQAAAAAAATLAALSGGRLPQIGSRVGPPSTPGLTVEQNIQRHLLQLQQQQQLAASGSVIHLPPSSPMHGTNLMTQMHAALAAVGVLPQPPQALPTTHTTAQLVHPRVATVTVAQSMPSLSAETSSRPSRPEFVQPQPFLSRTGFATARQALLLASTSGATAAAPVTTIPTPFAHGLQLPTSQPYSQALGRIAMMPPPPLPRVRHVLTQERRRYAPYQRPTSAFPMVSAPSAALIASTSAPERSSFQVGTLPSQSYYPSHFMHGTMIRLQSGQLKRVEEMTTEDFVLSAAMKTDLVLCSSRVMRIQETEQDQVLVTFAAGEQGILVTIQSGIEHPYFVFDQGWASCNPERTRIMYGLICRQLAVGDVCIALRHVEGGETSGASVRGTTRPLSSSRGGLVPGTSGIQQFPRPTSLIQATHRRSTPVIRVERRMGVRSAPSYELPTEELALLNMQRRLKRRRCKSAP